MRTIWMLIVVVAACSKADEGTGGAAKMAAGGADARDAVVEAWKKGGLTPSVMSPSTVAFGKDCQGGTVNNIDVLVCVYASGTEAAAAKDPGLAWVGEATGTSFVTGAVMIAIADRRKADTSGRTINQLMKLTPK
jgi:hypothetical protein